MACKTPSFVSAAEYLGDHLFSNYSRLKQQYPTTAPAHRTALLAEMGLSAMLADEVSQLSESLDVLDFALTERFTHAALGKTLKRHKHKLTISPELAELIRELPAKERARGEAEAEALRTLPPRKTKKKLGIVVEIAPDELPNYYEANALLVQTLLTIGKAMEKAHAIVEKQGQLGRIDTAVGTYGPAAHYHETPLVLCPKPGKKPVCIPQK